MPKPAIGKRNHHSLTISTRLELDKMADLFDRLIDEVQRLEKSRTKSVNEIGITILELMKHLGKTKQHVDGIWDLLTGQETAEKSAIETQLSAIVDRLDAHEEVIRLVQELIRERESDQLFKEAGQ